MLKLTKNRKIAHPFLAFTLLCLLFSSCVHENESADILRTKSLSKDLGVIENNLTIPHVKLSLQDMIDIALCQNLDLESKIKEISVQRRFAIRDQLKMIPQVIANGELSIRNNELIVSSESVEPGVPPAPPSISTDPHVIRYDINLILNLLDFGLSYFKARQETERTFLVALEYEKLRQTTILDVCKQYWKAVAAKTAMDESYRIFIEATKLQQNIKNLIKDRSLSLSKGMKSEADLLNLQAQLELFKNDYYKAISELTVLMGLPSSTYFEIEYDDERIFDVELPDIHALENIALMRRPELYIKDTEERITADEIRYAFLQMLPGAELFLGDFYDANSYFSNNYWVIAGARATWNIFALPNQYFNKQAFMKRRELVRTQRLALSIGVLSQVRLNYILYKENFEQYKIIHALEMTNQSLLDNAKNQYNLGLISRSELLFIDSQAFFSKINALKAYGELQITLEQLNYSTGSPRLYTNSNHSTSDVL